MGDVQLAEELRARGIRDERVLTAIATLSRANFVPPKLANFAQRDEPLPIGFEQTISQPYIVAFMTEALQLTGIERVLEIGTGSGYQAAVLAQLCGEVYTVEVLGKLAVSAEERLSRLGFDNVRVRHGDGSLGWPEEAPFDRILLTASPREIPGPLMAQLKRGGKLVAPVGPSDDAQELILMEKDAAGHIVQEQLLPVRFVPMRGDGRWV